VVSSYLSPQTYHVKLLLGLEGIRQLHQEGVVDMLQDVTLRRRVGQLTAADQGLLPQRLHRVQLPRALKTHQHDLAEAALAQHL